MRHPYRLVVWIALADFFTALSLTAFALYASHRAMSGAIPVDFQVRRLALDLVGRLQYRGIQASQPGSDVSIVLPEVLLFNSGDFHINDRSNLAKIADALKDVQSDWHRNFVLVIIGHTDSKPPIIRCSNYHPCPYRDNLALSQLRAQEVRDTLRTYGIHSPEFQVAAEGVGPAQPLVPNCRNGVRIDCGSDDNYVDVAFRAKNRRIELRFGVFSGNTSKTVP
jgi:outer membrane protein OmpA-like peptidoglycan-associated protein